MVPAQSMPTKGNKATLADTAKAMSPAKMFKPGHKRTMTPAREPEPEPTISRKIPKDPSCRCLSNGRFQKMTTSTAYSRLTNLPFFVSRSPTTTKTVSGSMATLLIAPRKTRRNLSTSMGRSRDLTNLALLIEQVAFKTPAKIDLQYDFGTPRV